MVSVALLVLGVAYLVVGGVSGMDVILCLCFSVHFFVDYDAGQGKRLWTILAGACSQTSASTWGC